MKFVTFDAGKIGAVVGADVVDLSSLAPTAPEEFPPTAMVRFIADYAKNLPRLPEAIERGARKLVSACDLQAPILWPNKIVAYPANYHAHFEEMKVKTGLISTYKADGQGFFLKANSSLNGPSDPIVLPKVQGREVHHECELAVIIGAGGRDISRDAAMDHVFGYSCLLDIVIRGKEERVMRKSFDSFCPMGPWIVTKDEAPAENDIQMSLSVNGVEKQRANTRNLIVDIPEMIKMASSVMTLYPGDIIATGTPAGVGPIASGDKIRIEIAGVGAMELDVVQGAGGGHEVWNKSADQPGGPAT
jgi:2-keto-4-pentenoate hydratase/2-oxohepta-3-ene-1,7-dioic acid hydratase in catechol pathway